MSSRSFLIIGLAAISLLLSSTRSGAQVPHTVIGQVFNSDDTVPEVGELSFEAYLVDVSNNNSHSETRTEADPGNAYGNGIVGPGWFEVECGNFTTFDWSDGDSLMVNFSNSINGEQGLLAVLLFADQEPQITADIILMEPLPDWSMSMDDDPDPVWAGQTVTYTINYQNMGDGTGTGVTILDTIPANTTYLSSTGGGNYDGQRVVWTLGAIPPRGSGSISLTLRVNSPLADGTVIINVAHITCDQEVETSVSQSLTVQAAPAWTFNLFESPDPVAAGASLTYSIFYDNTGSDQATGVVVVDTIPTHTTYVSNTGGGSYDGQRVIWNLGTISAGTSGFLSLTVLVDWPLPNGIQLEDVAYITCDQGVEAISSQTTQVVPDQFPPAAVTDLMASEENHELRLRWSAITTDIYGNPETMQGYIIYRNEAPYFTPTSVESIGVASDTSFLDDDGGAGNLETNSFYLVQGVDYVGNIGDNSNRAGEIDYRLPQTSSGYTMISLSLDDGITTLARELGAKVPNCSAVKVWNAEQRGYVSVAFKVNNVWHGSASVFMGHPYYLFVGTTAESLWTLAGQAPPDPSFDLVAPTGNDYNTISLPLSSDIATAKDLGAAIPYCTAVKEWSTKSQAYVPIAFKVGETWFGEGAVRRGYPYYVNVTNTSSWPPGKRSPQHRHLVGAAGL